MMLLKKSEVENVTQEQGEAGKKSCMEDEVEKDRNKI